MVVSSCLVLLVGAWDGDWRSGGGERSRLWEASWDVSGREWKLSCERLIMRVWKRSAGAAMFGLLVVIELLVIGCVRGGSGTDCLMLILLDGISGVEC